MKHYFDCKGCMKTLPRLTRQTLACGFEVAPIGVPVMAWDHPGRERAADERDDLGNAKPALCPGYTCNLPEVVEATYARLHWSKGQLEVAVPKPTQALIHALTMLESEHQRAQDWSIRNPVKGA